MAHKAKAPVMSEPADMRATRMRKAAVLTSEAGRTLDPAMKADLARKAEYIAHGVNGNKVHSKSAAIGPHDKD